ncbi:uncharacterized protein B0P05DRAFT_557431 [Gilbertella persicaria]|uniref:Uncharacterized protein n=1 Tax=Rhizopus stolonifer TaxID=4846 RepID=A0A367KJQ1_RHIST|nr:uncharacterized protein B0P05DRAFT_557431 [Gilbertella persicaria]KAI8061543.1 hypothetical protein B0P05DRAFT_557431 [Gilbertella persicaria]RCI02453.1 hypothetical protein CU098_004123 [Rhizopus stolonifer]
MLRQSVLHQPFSVGIGNASSNEVAIQKSLLLDIVNENHHLYQMEVRDRPNNIIRVLVELHKLGATQEQLSMAYQKTLLEVEPIRLSDSHKINERNWQEFLGLSSFYGDYLVFFDNQLSLLGLDETLDRYFYSIPPSMGSQLQPIVQLAFGIEHDLPQIVTQALAYYTTSYLDVSSILDYCDDPASNSNSRASQDALNTILFDLIRADQRFDGKIEGYNTFQSAVKLLLKSKYDLLKTYVKTWSTLSDSESRLEALVFSATTLYKMASRQQHDAAHVDLDWFLASGQLIDATLAIKQIMRPDFLEDWVNLLFLNTLCTYVVQGRPINNKNSKQQMEHTNFESCTATILHNSLDPKLVLAFTSLLKVTEQYPHFSSLCLDVANMLALFSKDGTWIKGGLGWTC